jgi:hypothetical protein
LRVDDARVFAAPARASFFVALAPARAVSARFRTTGYVMVVHARRHRVGLEHHSHTRLRGEPVGEAGVLDQRGVSPRRDVDQVLPRSLAELGSQRVARRRHDAQILKPRER